MYKRIVLLIFVVLNLNIYSQVVIKDEVNLYEIGGTDIATLQTPFYGDVFIHFIAPGQKMRAYFTVDGQTKFLNEIIGYTYDCTCGFPLWPLEVSWTFNNVPASRDVELQVLQCQQVSPYPPPNGTCDWIELTVDFLPFPPINNRWKILVDVNYPNLPPDWRYSGWIQFTATTPPGCDNAPDCSQFLPSYPHIELDLVGYSSDYWAGVDGCDRRYDPDRNAWSAPATKNHLNIFEFEDVCYNRQTQQWQFKTNNNNIVFMKFIQQVCSFNWILDDFSQLPPNYSCDDLMKDLDAMINRSRYMYLFKDILIWHERQHEYEMENALVKKRNSFIQEMDYDLRNYNCINFPTLQIAKLSAMVVYGNNLRRYYRRSALSVPLFTNTLSKKERSNLEDKLNSKIRGIINAYRIIARNYCSP